MVPVTDLDHFQRVCRQVIPKVIGLVNIEADLGARVQQGSRKPTGIDLTTANGRLQVYMMNPQQLGYV